MIPPASSQQTPHSSATPTSETNRVWLASTPRRFWTLAVWSNATSDGRNYSPPSPPAHHNPPTSPPSHTRPASPPPAPSPLLSSPPPSYQPALASHPLTLHPARTPQSNPPLPNPPPAPPGSHRSPSPHNQPPPLRLPHPCVLCRFALFQKCLPVNACYRG